MAKELKAGRWFALAVGLYLVSLFTTGLLWSLIYAALISIPLVAIHPFVRGHGKAVDVLYAMCGGLLVSMWLAALPGA